LRYLVERMELEDIPQIQQIDRESYTVPWPASAYRRELMHNRNAHYYVIRELAPGEETAPQGLDDEQRYRRPLGFLPWPRREELPRPGTVVGYGGMWLVLDEAHITTIAMRTSYRGRGLGELLLASMIVAAGEMGSDRVTLEVRISNVVAQNLYRKYGFREEGVRPRYYSDNNEDAYIMTADQIRSGQYRETFDRLVSGLRPRLEAQHVGVVSPVFSFPEDAGASVE
jgi:ribosomal-protein-alanine N-acetyltransferase